MGKKGNKRFEVVLQEASLATNSTILKDKETGVLYYFFGSGYGGGLTALLDKDGKPMIDVGKE